jgi:hypothetical protein
LVPGNGPLKEPDAGLGVLAGQELGVGESRVVVDRDVKVLPADPSVAVRAASLVAEHTLARLPEAPEFLGVDVQQLARPLALVAAGAASGRFCGARQTRAAMSAQDLPDR